MISRRLEMGGGGSFSPSAPTTVSQDGSRVTLFSGANTYSWSLVKKGSVLYLFTTESPGAEHAAGTGAYVRNSTDSYTTRTLLYAGGGAGRHGNIESAFVTSTGRILVSLDDQAEANPYDVIAKVIYSDDGSTWSSPYTVTNTFSGDCVGGTFAELGGSIFLSLYGEQTGIVGGNTFVKRVVSSNDGATFGSEITVASSASRTYQEPQMAYIDSGLVMLMRSDTAANTWRTTSADGTTWSAPANVLTASGPPQFLEWYAGKLFMMLRQDAVNFRPRWTVSTDRGATWAALAEVDTGETRELDSTGMCMTDDRHFTTIYSLLNSSTSSTVYLREWEIT